MPIVRVSGLPGDAQPADVAFLRLSIQRAVMSVKELEIGALDWTDVQFLARHPADEAQPQRLVIEEAGLFRGDDWPQRTPLVRQTLAGLLARAVRKLFQQWRHEDRYTSLLSVEVLEWPFDTTLAMPLDAAEVPDNRQGYASFRLDED